MDEKSMGEIMDAVAASHDTMRVSMGKPCECGGHFFPSMQSLTYDPEMKCMIDLWTMVCSGCKKEDNIKVPLRGGVYAQMADFC